MAQPSALVEMATFASARAPFLRLMLRVVALVGLAVVCLFVPQVGPHRFHLAAVLVALTPVPVLMARHLQQRAMLGQSIFDVVATGALIWLVPDVWTAGLVIVVAAPAASAAMNGKRVYLLLEGAGLVMLGVAAAFTGVDGWLVPWLVAVLLMPLIGSYVDVFLTQELTASGHLRDVVDSTPVIVAEVDATTGELLSVYGRVQQILGWTDEDRAGLVYMTDVLHPDDAGELADVVALGPGTSVQRQSRFLHADGSWVWLRHSLHIVTVRSRIVIRSVAFDVTELMSAHDQMRWRAERDELTGLANRTVLLEELGQRLDRGEPVALLMLDLDGFKEINDTLGHHAGDVFLQALAARLPTLVSAGDLVARLGGDEFAVVSSDHAERRAAWRLASRITAGLEQPVSVEGLELVGAASVGIAVAPEHGSDPTSLLRRADVAMYVAKRSRLSVHTFDVESDEPTIDRLTLSREVEVALARGDLRLWFQPKVDLATGRLTGAEGLLRWHHAQRGVLLPADFLDVIELSRHHRAVADEVVSQGIAFAAAMRDAGTAVRVAVNVSIRTLSDRGFLRHVATQLDSCGLDPAMLVLEITEREIMEERAGSRVDADALRALGVGLSIDDFGTGHSSLLRLHQLPVTEVKIDRSFIDGLGRDDEALILVRSVIELARGLGLVSVAEGIERPYEAEVVQAMGCEQAQGYLWSPAVPADEFERFAHVFATQGPASAKL
jgi:diguanylate cyclase (GGDEF)-like protein/PAS domain S-box-containing protein